MPTSRALTKRWTQWLQKNRVCTIATVAVLFTFGAVLPANALIGFDDAITSGIPLFFDIMTLYLGFIINIIGYAIGKLIVLLLGMVVIPILGYNGFADSNIIDIGWPLVRDVVNMFVIVILLVIAIRTMIGYKDANWQQQLPRLFIAIVAVNFSRTITLLIVDIGQVVMFTFVNALRDIAAGNFVSMFRLTEFYSHNIANIESVTAFEAGASMLDDVGFLATSYVTVLFLIAVLGVIILLAVVFIYRIVVIWILVIMSPLAFFLGGIQSAVPRAGQQYGQWWDKLIGAVALGPILTFFLWLALAAAAEGSIASSEGFPTEGTEDIPSLLAEVFQIDQLLSLFIAMVLIMAGFQAASSSASSLGGFAGKMISEGTGKTLVAGAAKLPASLAYRGAKTAGRAGLAAGRLGLRGAKAGGIELARQLEARGGVISETGKKIIGAGGELERKGGFAGRLAGRAVRGAGGWVQGQGDAFNTEARTGSKERLDKKSRDERVANLMDLDKQFDASGQMKKNAFFSSSDQFNVEEGFKRLLTDKNERKKLKSMSGQRAKEEAEGMTFANTAEREAWEEKRQGEMMDSTMKRAIVWSDSDTGKAVLDDVKDEVKKAKAGNLRSLGNSGEISDFLTEMGDDFKVSMISEEDMKDEQVLQALSKREMRRYPDRNGNWISESALDQAAEGKGGVDAKVMRAAKGEGAKFDDLVRYAGVERNADGTEKRDAAGNVVRQTIEGATSVGQALKNNNLQLRNLTVDHLIATDAAGNAVVDAAGNRQFDENKVAAIAKAIAESKSDAGDLAQLPTEAYGAVLQSLRDSMAAAMVTGDNQAVQKYQKAIISADQAPDLSATAGILANGDITPATREVVQQFITEQPSQILKFEANIMANPGATNLTSEIARNVNQSTIKNMQVLLNQAIAKNNTGLANRIKASARTIATALERQAPGTPATATTRAVPSPRRSEINSLRQIQRYT